MQLEVATQSPPSEPGGGVLFVHFSTAVRPPHVSPAFSRAARESSVLRWPPLSLEVVEYCSHLRVMAVLSVPPYTTVTIATRATQVLLKKLRRYLTPCPPYEVVASLMFYLPGLDGPENRTRD